MFMNLRSRDCRDTFRNIGLPVPVKSRQASCDLMAGNFLFTSPGALLVCTMNVGLMFYFHALEYLLRFLYSISSTKGFYLSETEL